MPGRKKIPDKLKILHGTNQPVRMNKNQPKFEMITKVPHAPKWFSELAKKLYYSTAKELALKQMLSEINLPFVVAYANEMATYYELQEELLTEGRVIRTPQGRVQNPLVKISGDALKKAQSLASEFGLTPASQSRINIATSDPVDPLTEFLK